MPQGYSIVRGSKDTSLLAEEVLSASAASITFASITADYRHLRIVLLGRSTVASVSDTVLLRMNGDSSGTPGTDGNYDWQRLFGNAGTAGASESLLQTSITAGQMAGADAPAGVADQTVIDLAHYAGTTFQKTTTSSSTRKTANSTGGLAIFEFAGWWRNTAAITSLTLLPSGGSFATGTVASLYGMKGA